MDPQVSLNFTCQRCHQPVHLDQGFSHLTELTLAELALPICKATEVDFEGYELDKTVPSLQLQESNQESNGQNSGFTFVGMSSEDEKYPPLKIASNLFDLLTSNSDIDHPLCEECTDSLLDMMDTCLNRTQNQAALYEKLFNDDSKVVDEDLKYLEIELKNLEVEESKLLSELQDVEKEQEEAQAVLTKCQEEKTRLEEEEENYWREYCMYKCQMTALEDENRSLKSRMNNMQHHLDRLRQTNVFNATFHIWYSGYFGTINNLRLGRLPTAAVTWPEINAAWGQTALLLASLARKIGFKFSKYKLVPHGNTSYIEVIGENKELRLYGSSGLRFMWDNKFDAGMVAFLECVAEFQQFIESNCFQHSKKKFCLPYRITNHCMEDTSGQLYPIKMQFNSEEQWTKALKFLLTNLKWALTWVSSSLIPPNVQQQQQQQQSAKEDST